MQEKNVMSLEGFATCIKIDVKKKMGKDYEVYIQNVTKNNGIELKGLVVTSAESNVSPTIYLNPYYSKYENGEDYDKLLEEIISVYGEHRVTGMLDVSFFKDWKKAREGIVFKLVSFEGNRELLKNIPYVKFLDLAMVFNYWLRTPCGEYATILVHNEHLDFWGISQEELYDAAVANTPEILPYKFGDMMQIMMLMAVEGGFHFANFQEMQPMYILTNQYKINGAGCILYPEILKTFADMMESDLCIIPSSVHETLLIPILPDGEGVDEDPDSIYYGMTQEEMLNAVVKDINQTQLAPEEILSDHIYRYIRATDKIVM